jgi:hypothetical protein
MQSLYAVLIYWVRGPIAEALVLNKLTSRSYMNTSFYPQGHGQQGHGQQGPHRHFLLL